MQGIDLSDLVPEFLSEVREHLEALERGLLQLELSGAEEFQKKLINGLFRAAHTIKGSARVMGYDAISRVAHAMEDILDDCRENQKNPHAASIDKLLRAADRLRTLADQPATSQEGADAMIAELRGGTTASAPAPEAVTPQAPVPEHPSPEPPAPVPSAPPGPPPAPAVASAPAPAPVGEQPSAGPAQEAPTGTETVRVAVSRLDELLRLSGELVMGVQRLEAVQKRRGVLVGGLNRFLQSVVGKEQRLRSGESFSDETASDIVSEAKRFVGEIESFRGESGDVARLLPSITERIEQEVMGLRLYPLSAVFGTLPRLVRDLSKEHGKPVDLVIEGERTELDRRVIQGLSEPLLHIVRNAVDHGLETPEEREAVGKPRTGRFTVTAVRQGGRVFVDLEDDGRGLDAQKLRETAVRKKLLSHDEAAALDDQAALELIYLPGFSTSALITTTSGRGVGMDAVVASLQKLGGSVELTTEKGKGTRFRLALPLTVTISHALLVEVGDRVYALPSAGVERIVKLSRQNVTISAGREQVLLEREPVSILRVARLLSRNALAESGALEGPALVVKTAGGRFALAVSRVVDEKDVVLKPLGEILARGELASAATLLPDGSLVLVLDPLALVRAGRGTRRRREESSVARGPRKVLVADDSTTTRELERSILVASGFEVETAVDGEDAWSKLQLGDFDLLITDVEMPGMNGFELTEKVRRDPRFAGLPVVIITSLDKDSERRRGLSAGAQAYLVKNSFDQTALLETLERLLP